MSLTERSIFIQRVREFFFEKDFIEVHAPPMVENPGMETHIHPYQVYSVKKQALEPLYLHTSPEFYLKDILAKHPEENIFSLGYCFRDEPQSTIHREQFLMLEWYRKGVTYDAILEDCCDLIAHLAPNARVEVATVDGIFQRYCNFSILEYLEAHSLFSYLNENLRDYLPELKEGLLWEDYFWLVFLNIIEPQLKNYPYLVLKEYPAHLAALSTIKESDPRVCERFELYINGVEIANCFNELLDLGEQKKRFTEQAKLKKELYSYELNEPKKFYETLERGLPKSAGIALGVERLYGQITGHPEIFE